MFSRFRYPTHQWNWKPKSREQSVCRVKVEKRHKKVQKLRHLLARCCAHGHSEFSHVLGETWPHKFGLPDLIGEMLHHSNTYKSWKLFSPTTDVHTVFILTGILLRRRLPERPHSPSSTKLSEACLALAGSARQISPTDAEAHSKSTQLLTLAIYLFAVPLNHQWASS